MKTFFQKQIRSILLILAVIVVQGHGGPVTGYFCGAVRQTPYYQERYESGVCEIFQGTCATPKSARMDIIRFETTQPKPHQYTVRALYFRNLEQSGGDPPSLSDCIKEASANGIIVTREKIKKQFARRGYKSIHDPGDVLGTSNLQAEKLEIICLNAYEIWLH